MDSLNIHINILGRMIAQTWNVGGRNNEDMYIKSKITNQLLIDKN